MHRRLFPGDHPDVAWILHNLAGVRRARGPRWRPSRCIKRRRQCVRGCFPYLSRRLLIEPSVRCTRAVEFTQNLTAGKVKTDADQVIRVSTKITAFRNATLNKPRPEAVTGHDLFLRIRSRCASCELYQCTERLTLFSRQFPEPESEF